MTARLRETYKNEVFPALKEKFNYENVMEVPKLVKVTINMGLGEAKENAKIMETAVKELGLISGQWLMGLIVVAGQYLMGLLAAYGGRRSDLGKYDAGQILGLRHHLKTLKAEKLEQILLTGGKNKDRTELLNLFHDTLIGFAMDHGCHEIDGDLGSHGLDMPEDLNIVHLYDVYPAK